MSLQILKNFNISHQHSKNYTGFQSNKELITNSIFFTYRILTNRQPTYLHNSLSFPSHPVSTRSSDSLVLSIPYVRSSLSKGLSLSSVHDSGIHSLLIPKTRLLLFFTNIPIQAQNTFLQNCVSSLCSFTSPLTVYPDFDCCYSYTLCPIEC